MVRGDLPPIAATLNNVLKSDAPGGLIHRAISFSVLHTQTMLAFSVQS